MNGSDVVLLGLAESLGMRNPKVGTSDWLCDDGSPCAMLDLGRNAFEPYNCAAALQVTIRRGNVCCLYGDPDFAGNVVVGPSLDDPDSLDLDKLMPFVARSVLQSSYNQLTIKNLQTKYPFRDNYALKAGRWSLLCSRSRVVVFDGCRMVTTVSR